jgi:hypothetical protein
MAGTRRATDRRPNNRGDIDMQKRPSTGTIPGGHPLSAYLHAHVTAAAAGERLFEQAAKSWRDTAYAAELARLAAEVSEDKRALEDICARLHARMPAYKEVLAWAGGQLAALSPLNPVHSIHGAKGQLELESLISAVTGKLLLWKTLRVLSRDENRIDPGRIEQLSNRAADQIRTLETLLLGTCAARLAPSAQDQAGGTVTGGS